ncbi:MAG: hypothetical protein QW086_11745, partial [Pyrobaculum sp.]
KAVVPYAQSKYYTEEVRRRLIALLDKEIKDYTWDAGENRRGHIQRVHRDGEGGPPRLLPQANDIYSNSQRADQEEGNGEKTKQHSGVKMGLVGTSPVAKLLSAGTL